MSTVNVKTPPTHVTHEGAPARRIPVEAELRRTVMACLLWEDTFYESGRSIAERIGLLVSALPPRVVADMALEARTAMKLRHVPLLLLCKLLEGPPAARMEAGRVMARVIQRPDELTELLALWWTPTRRKLPAQLKKGLAAAFVKFNAYQLAKYNRDGRVKLRDVLFLTHPTPKDAEQAATWKHLADVTLPAPDTWEVALSTGADKRETWVRLLTEQKLGGLALLRNLRNMDKAGVPEALVRGALATMSTDRILPFRFVAAARYAPVLEPDLEAAMYRAASHVPKLPGKTALLVDNSGSMHGPPISAKSDMDRADAACALAILLREMCEAVDVIGFGTSAALVPARRGFALRDAIRNGPGGGTNTEAAKALADQRGYDRIIIVTDEQSHQALSSPKGRGYVINVAPYQRGIGYGAWTHIDGWSEAVVEYVRQAESLGGITSELQATDGNGV